MKISPEMRLSWLERWQLMDADGSKLLDYSEFLEACGLPDNMWSWRMFNLLDKNFVGTGTPQTTAWTTIVLSHCSGQRTEQRLLHPLPGGETS